ncbi:MAG TPA: tryptophan synthase subunit alpha [Phycisphaerae bacterium]|nr:tryptophan synthase subunit alpha [Phycisphaerales bacterium]HRX86919.1 tryptophan synthase subunit alpha [Phycisphaerae bacterium]
MSQRLEQRLKAATANGGKCLMPYLTAGFPDLATTAQLIARCDQAGCPAIEIGFPFSDSIADGPVIQESFYHALDAGFRVDALFETIAGIRANTSTALIAMVSMSLVMKRGPETFARDAAGAGFDALIVPDVPVDEAAQLTRTADAAGLCNVLMIAPTSASDRQARIASSARGFLYVIASRGITGERDQVARDLGDHVQALRKLTAVPLIAGFGISTPDHVRDACRYTDGVIVGSAIIRRITACVEAGDDAPAIVRTVGTYVDELSGGLVA